MSAFFGQFFLNLRKTWILKDRVKSQRWFVLGSLIQNIINSCLICLIKTRSSYSIFMWALNEINIPHSCQMSEDNRRHPLIWHLLYNLALFGCFFKFRVNYDLKLSNNYTCKNNQAIFFSISFICHYGSSLACKT